MYFSFAFISSVFLAVSTVLAHRPLRHSHLGVASRRGGRQPRLNHRQAADANVVNSDSWAGAILDPGGQTFSHATGIFTAPNISGSGGSSASAWVGIDSENGSGPFQAGIDFTVTEEGKQYDAWFEWYPADSIYPDSNINISAGDRIRITLVATNSTSGIATIENLNNGQNMSQTLTNPSTPMMRRRAEWLVEDYMDKGGSSASLANFGTVIFTDCYATTTEHGSYTPADAEIREIMKSGKVVTSVSINGSSVTVQYI
ncbi:peptidase A4 family-domain-containing protein [Chiua virens]|nr:peptidase A4 family-domain-containing protein [Chiua virens]